MTHGPFFSPLSLYDPKGFFPKLKEAAETPTKEDFRHAINEVLVGEMYEFVGKLRNVSLNGLHIYLPYLAVEFAQYGAMLVGLHNQKFFSTGSMVLPEALERPSRPGGFDNVVRMVMSGEPLPIIWHDFDRPKTPLARGFLMQNGQKSKDDETSASSPTSEVQGRIETT